MAHGSDPCQSRWYATEAGALEMLNPVIRDSLGHGWRQGHDAQASMKLGGGEVVWGRREKMSKPRCHRVHMHPEVKPFYVNFIFVL